MVPPGEQNGPRTAANDAGAVATSTRGSVPPDHTADRRAAVEASPEDEPTGGPCGRDNASDAD